MSYIHLKYDVQCSEIHFFQTNRHQSDEDSPPPDTARWLRLVWWWKCFKAPEVGWNWLNQKKLRVTKSLNNNCCYQQEFLRNFTRMMVNTDRIINSLMVGQWDWLCYKNEYIVCDTTCLLHDPYVRLYIMYRCCYFWSKDEYRDILRFAPSYIIMGAAGRRLYLTIIPCRSCTMRGNLSRARSPAAHAN